MAVSTPAIPASGVPVPNQTGQYVDAAITGGTVTAVNIIDQNGNSTQVASGTGVNIGIPPGFSISWTGSVAPTSWNWTDPVATGYTPTYSAENLALINEIGQLPYAAHTEGGEPGLGAAVSN